MASEHLFESAQFDARRVIDGESERYGNWLLVVAEGHIVFVFMGSRILLGDFGGCCLHEMDCATLLEKGGVFLEEEASEGRRADEEAHDMADLGEGYRIEVSQYGGRRDVVFMELVKLAWMSRSEHVDLAS